MFGNKAKKFIATVGIALWMFSPTNKGIANQKIPLSNSETKAAVELISCFNDLSLARKMFKFVEYGEDKSNKLIAKINLFCKTGKRNLTEEDPLMNEIFEFVIELQRYMEKKIGPHFKGTGLLLSSDYSLSHSERKMERKVEKIKRKLSNSLKEEHISKLVNLYINLSKIYIQFAKMDKEVDEVRISKTKGISPQELIAYMQIIQKAFLNLLITLDSLTKN